jgi:O-antigen/teichoic acid export membrane protein
MANPIKSLLSQTAIYGVSSILGRFINFLLVPFYSYIFVTSKFGVVAELTAYTTILVVLLTYGMETAYFRFCQNENYKRNQVYSTAFTSILSTSLFFLLGIFLAGHSLAELIGYGSFPEFIYLISLTLALDTISAIPFAKLRIENKARKFAAIKLVNIFTNVFFNIFFLYLLPVLFGNSNIIYQLIYPEVHVGYIFISFFISSLVTLILLVGELRDVLKAYSMSFVLLKSMLIYGFPVLIAGLAGMFSESLDRVLLRYFITVPEAITNKGQYILAEIGIYGANVKIAVIMTLFLQAFRYAAEPFFFNYSKHDDSKLIYGRVMKYFIAFSLFIFLGVTLFIDVIKYMLDTDYREGIAVVPMLLLSKIFFGIVFNLSIWYKLKNKTYYGALLAILCATVSISLNILLIPVYGYHGAAWASVIAYFVMMVVSFILERKHFKIPYDFKAIGLYFTVALSFYFLNVLFRSLAEWYLFVNFFLIMFFIFIFVKKEQLDIKHILHHIKTIKKSK